MSGTSKKRKAEDPPSGGAAPKRQSTRVSRPPKDKWVQSLGEKKAEGPKYSKESDADAGSREVTAKLTPASLTGMGTDADPNLPKGIKKARAEPGWDAKYHFKAGHMLNADLGGDGKNPANMTILTSSANTAMTKYDNKLKQAVEALEKAYEAFYDAKASEDKIKEMYIEVKISASSDKWGKTPPHSYIAKKIDISAEFKGKHGTTKTDYKCDDPDKAASDIAKCLSKVDGLVKQANGTVDNTP